MSGQRLGDLSAISQSVPGTQATLGQYRLLLRCHKPSFLVQVVVSACRCWATLQTSAAQRVEGLVTLQRHPLLRLLRVLFYRRQVIAKRMQILACLRQVV